MSKRPRVEAAAADRTVLDRMVLDVGGERFVSSTSTLSGSSAYFEALFARWEDSSTEIFLDRDPDAFRVLLSCMRAKRALLPENDKDLFRRALLDASYLGMDWLQQLVRATVVGNAPLADQVAMLEAYNEQIRLQQVGSTVEPLHGIVEDLTQSDRAKLFPVAFGSIEEALDQGVLPSQFFKKPERSDRIRQLVPCRDNDEVVFFRDGDAAETRKALALALVEGSNGNTHVEPVVRSRGWRKPYGVNSAWLTTFKDEQLVTATGYMHHVEGVEGCHWAYAYDHEQTKNSLDELSNR